ncbi:hypothetical protein XBKQ1_2380003 [Xenorhabdus bovienii str. kraussei Quebec]|uniref:Uncharacterized protein n=1 Tax=Xenorhabdus bovienii str. kraussei Quebec TaxID=1398203 RepID=A0A077PFM2_XENBV|nr:hypothetical protein XBKQ1_2380003 [Xenorhabdus bovienii str. kraussei Quebec]
MREMKLQRRMRDGVGYVQGF